MTNKQFKFMLFSDTVTNILISKKQHIIKAVLK